jgi:ATP-binding cassette, subfamily C, bacterial
MSTLRAFSGALVRKRPWRLAWVVIVQAASAFGQVVGILLLVLLLGAVGVSSRGGISHWLRHLLESLGLSPTLGTVLAIYVVVTAASAVLSAYQSVLSTRYRLEFVDGIRVRLYAALAHAEWRHVMELRQSDLLAELTTNVVWIGMATLGALNLLVAVIVITGQLAAAVPVSPAMTGLALLSGVLLMAVVWPLVRRSRRLGTQLVDRSRYVMELATGFLDALKLAKAYGREREHVRAFDSAISGLRASQIEYARAGGISAAVQTSLTALLLAITVWIAVRVVHVPLSALLVVAFVFMRLISQITTSQQSLQQIAQGLPAFGEAMRVIAECERAAEPVAVVGSAAKRVPIGTGLAFEDVSFTYPGGAGRATAALRGVSLELPVGSMLALAGSSGAGKTTLADLAAGLMMPSAGAVTVDGRPLTRERLLGWRRSVALVPQDPFLFHDTIEANLRWARPEASEQQLWEALRVANAADFVQADALGLSAVVGDRGLRLSGGERQRLALARALLREPELLILDEATSSLDTENERAIRAAISELHGRTTILLIAHRLSTVREADLIAVLEAGKVVESGSWSALSGMQAGRLQSLIAAGAPGTLEPTGAEPA